jgi:hypothetical protein
MQTASEPNCVAHRSRLLEQSAVHRPSRLPLSAHVRPVPHRLVLEQRAPRVPPEVVVPPSAAAEAPSVKVEPPSPEAEPPSEVEPPSPEELLEHAMSATRLRGESAKRAMARRVFMAFHAA